MRWLLASMLLCCAGAASCDRRPEAPLLERTGKGASSLATTEDSSPRSSPATSRGSSGAERCLVPTAVQAPPKPLPAAECPTDPVFRPPVLKTAKLSFPEADGAPTIEVELAVEPEQRQRGLMYRKHLDEDKGMLFDFPGTPRIQSFWMHNTCIPLDMLFVAEDGFITGIQENVPTLNDDSRSIRCPVRYVLEVNAGWTRAHGVRAGQKVKLPGQD